MTNTRKPTSVNHRRSHRVVASLNREQVDFLDKLGKDALFSSGVKLSRTHILSAMVNALRDVQLSGEGLRSPEQFEQRILAMIQRSHVRPQLTERSVRQRRISLRLKPLAET